MAGEAVKRGFSTLLIFIAIISVNLGIVNLLPIPVLDGGQVMIFTIEGIRRRPLSQRQKIILQQIGMALLLLLMIFITFYDIVRML